MKKNASGVVIYDNEKRKMLGLHASLCVHALGDTPYYDDTSVYATRQENDHYVSHNVDTTVAIPNRCPTPTATRECSPNKKGTQEVWNRLVGAYWHV